ncbi:putative potassium channel, BK, alpha subunit, NAD(P)-binding domain superfamily [Plasmopara halstedii]
MSEYQHLHQEHKSNYGALLPIKRTLHQLHPQQNTHSVNFEAESGNLFSTTKIISVSHGSRSCDRLSRYLDHSSFGIGLDTFLALVSIVFASSYVAFTYVSPNGMPYSLWITDIVCAGLFAADFLFRGIYLSSHRRDYMLSFSGIVTLAVVLPVLPTSFFLRNHTLWCGISNWRFVYPVRFAMCYIKAKAVLSRCHGLLSPVQQFVILCYLQLMIIIAVAAGVIQVAETANSKYAGGNLGEWTFFNSFFNSVLAFVTIQSPPAENPLAKVCVGALVLVLILIVPYQVSQILALGSSFSPYELATHSPSSTSKHIILCGDLTPSRIDHFFHEVFHDDHDLVDINVVVLSEEEPATSLIALLMDPFFEKRASFIQGSLLDVDDSQRAACASANAIFILARRVAGESPASSDHRALMRVLAARREAPNARVFVQLHLSVNRSLVADLGVSSVLCFSEVMHSLLGQNCVCPGFSTFIYSLTSTSSYVTSGDYDEPPEADASWEDRYLHGSSHEVYSVELPPASVVFGKTFSEVASLAYAQCSGVIVFAITTARSSSEGSSDRLLLNPGDSYTCAGAETVFVIARDRREANAVTEMQATLTMPEAWMSQRQKPSSRHFSREDSAKSKLPITIKSSTNDDTFGNSNSDDMFTLHRRRSRLINWQSKAVSPASIDSHENLTTWSPEENDDNLLTVKTSDLSPTHERGNSREAVIQDVTSLNLKIGHIVVCVLSPLTFPHHLEYFIGPLRVRALRLHRPVVFVTTTLPEADEYELFQRFSNVHFIIGDPFCHSTLRRADVHRAFRIVLMGAEGDISDSGTSELLQDAACIALHKTIMTLIGPKRAPRIITELVNRANVHFVAQNLTVSGWFPLAECDSAAISTSSLELARNFAVSPAFAAGLTYSTSLCDSLLINQFFNARIKNILREFIFASWTDGGVGTLPSSPATTGGFEDATASPALSPSSNSSVQRSSLFAVEVPLDFVGRTFEFVFHYLLSSDGILVIGIYRCRPDVMLQSSSVQLLKDGQWTKSGPRTRIEVPESERSVPFGYVYVNPQPHEVLTGNDLLYVLSDIQPCWADTANECPQ